MAKSTVTGLTSKQEEFARAYGEEHNQLPSWEFHYRHGGSEYELWRDVLDTFQQTFNFLVIIDYINSPMFQLHHDQLSLSSLRLQLESVQARLEDCGYVFDRPDFGDDAYAYFESMLMKLCLLKNSLLHDAVQGFNNEMPNQPSVLNG